MPRGREILVGLAVLTTALAATAQLELPHPRPVLGARMPALSPDGKRLVFVYRGDLWSASAQGGRAQVLTENIEMDGYPHFSPDGKWVAFASKRNGNWDIYAIPSEGGIARQLTFHSEDELPQCWSPDGKKILFSAKYGNLNHTLFALDVVTLKLEKLYEDYAPIRYATFSGGEKMIAFSRYGFHWSRPRYHGSAAGQVHWLDPKDLSRHQLTDTGFQHLWPIFLPNSERLVAVTVGEATPSTSKLSETLPKFHDNSLRTPNLWLLSWDGKRKPLTSFSGGGVRWPTVAARSGDIAFEYGFDLWFLKSGKEEPKKISLFAQGDEKLNTRRREKLTTGVSEAEPSPDGKLFAFGLRGDIWTVPIDKPKGVAGRSAEFARRLTDWVGDDSDFSWSRDGKKLYFTSDRQFNTRIYELELEGLKIKSLWTRDEDVARLRRSPDGKHLGFWVSGPEGGLHLYDLEKETLKKVVSAPGTHWRGMGGGDFEWSPDLRWIAYVHRSESRAWNIWIVNVETLQTVNLTELYANHSLPAWSPDGKYLFFQSNRDGEGLYTVPLQREPVRLADTDLKFEKPTNSVTVEIDFDGISRRIRKVASASPAADLQVTAEGLVLFISEGDIWSVSYEGKETKRLTTGGGKSHLRVAADGKKGYYAYNGDLQTIKLDDKSSEKVTFAADWERDVKAERQAAFAEFWRSYHRGFYDRNFHGRDWGALRVQYEPLLEAVETADEFARLLQMMAGELETSHAEVTPAPGGAPGPVTPHLGFTIDYGHGGPGLRVAEVPAGTPGSYRLTRIQPGDYVMAINGQAVNPDENLFEFINDKQDREFEFLVNTNATTEGARTVRYKVLSTEEWTELNYRNRIERLRQRVEKQSQGRVGYLHIASMGTSNQAQFEREAYEYVAGRQAMILDVRFNNGGNIADTLIDWLERKPHGFVRPRDGAPEPSPARAWDKPMVVLMNEHSYSNAEIFPSAMRARGLAKLVGKATPGYVIWTGNLRLIDGTIARMPQSGSYRLDGTSHENNGEIPDVVVELTPEDWLADRDPQLDKAIELLLPSTPDSGR